MKGIYLSYANQDLSLAKSVKEQIENCGLTVCLIDHTEENLNGDVASEMLDGIKKSDVLVNTSVFFMR